MSQTIAKIGFIGAGNMGTAIMKAIRSKFDAAEIYAADPDQAKLEALKAFGVQPCADAAAVTDTCKYVFLAVKPQVIEGVLESIADHVTADTVLYPLPQALPASTSSPRPGRMPR